MNEHELRARLSNELQAAGCLRSEQWRNAVETVPRHLFVPEFFYPVTTSSGMMWNPITPETTGAGEQMALSYENKTLVTQLDGHIRPGDTQGATTGRNPTSSSTLPGLVVAMLEDLAVSDDSRVLEIGTGSGYSTALLCHRLGSERVVSVEADPLISAQAATAIRQAGYEPTLVTADGLDGFGPQAPYDRVIATCSVRYVPPAWVNQVTRGGIILATISGWQYGSAYARIVVNSDGTASGTFLPDTYSFMLVRSQAPPPANAVDTSEVDTATPRATNIGLNSLDDWTASFIAQLAAPDAQYIGKRIANGPMVDYLIDVNSGSAASVIPGANGTSIVREAGPLSLWSRIEKAITAWHQHGQPAIEHFRINVTPDSQIVFAPGIDALNWRLPGF